MGSAKGEFWWRISRFSWFGHQSRFDRATAAFVPFAPFITGHFVSVAIWHFLLSRQNPWLSVGARFLQGGCYGGKYFCPIRSIGKTYGRLHGPATRPRAN